MQIQMCRLKVFTDLAKLLLKGIEEEKEKHTNQLATLAEFVDGEVDGDLSTKLKSSKYK
jgi:hypothetical protein